MTLDEARALLRTSTVWKNQGGDPLRMWAAWSKANPGERLALLAYATKVARPDTEVPRPPLKSAYGQAMVEFVRQGAYAFVPRNGVTSPARPLLGAMVVTAGNMDVDLLRAAGVTHVCVETTRANADDFLTDRWTGFTKGWFAVSRGNDGDAIARALEATAAAVSFAVIDTESHKTDMGGSLAWTETLYAALRSKLGPAFPLFNVTFGIHSSPAVVNHDAFRRHNVTPIWEAYDGEGVTLGVDRTATKAELEGWAAHVAIGDKSLHADSVELKNGAVTGLAGVWLWAPDNGPAQEALRNGAAVALKAAVA